MIDAIYAFFGCKNGFKKTIDKILPIMYYILICENSIWAKPERSGDAKLQGLCMKAASCKSFF